MQGAVSRIAVLGAGGVGKSCVVLRLIKDSFDPEYIPTIQDYLEKELIIDGTEITLKIIDTAGQEDMSDITDIGINEADMYVIVYSIISANSLSKAEEYFEKVVNGTHKIKRRILLIGNKCDLEAQREVPTEKGLELANKMGCELFEVSAKTRQNIDKAFSYLLGGISYKIKKKLNEAIVEPTQKKDEPKNDDCCLIA